jgi:hypothetical protein
MRGRDAIALACLVGALSLPFLNKAFHIDDTYFLRITANVLEDPMDPFAGSIDWWDRPLPVWRLASNPPLLSYYLAPFAAWSDFSERALHAAMIPFLALYALAVFHLARRFSDGSWLALMFALTSAGIVVSSNVMRDVPTAALTTAAVAAVVTGTDRNDGRWVGAGFLLAGLALLTRFTALVILPVLVLPPLLKGRLRLTAWLALPLLMLALWCVHNWWTYGELQLLAQLDRGHNRPGHAWSDNLCGLPVVLGSLLYIAPALLVHAAVSRDRSALLAVALAWPATAWLTQRYLEWGADAQYLFWSLGGCAVLVICALEGVRGARRPTRDPRGADSLLLLAWLGAQLAVAVVLAPFQAVRHLIPALPPLVLLGFRYLAPGLRRHHTLLATLVGVQAGIAFTVAIADSDYADAYRDFAARAEAQLGTEDDDIWFLGHWGWLYYAERAGLRKLHATGPYPETGDLLIVPVQVDKGAVLERTPRLRERLLKLDEILYAGRTPFRTMHTAGAGFYAMRSRRGAGHTPSVPYRLMPAAPVEVFEIHQVGAPR